MVQQFTEAAPAPPFIGVQFGAVAFSDVNGDGSKDVLITGVNNGFVRISKLYINKGWTSSVDDLSLKLDLGVKFIQTPQGQIF